MLRGAVMAGAIMAAAIGTPVQAQRCWNQALVEAAQVKEFEIMLMVATLRCQARGTDISGIYNRFIAAHRPVLLAVGEELVREFKVSQSGNAALKAYDRLGVLMANKYGNGVQGLECADFEAIIMQAEAAPKSKADLVSLAQRAGMDPQLPAPRCAAAGGIVAAR